jgi:hypothetical protein
MVATVFMITSVSCVDLPIFLLLRGPLAVGLKESSPGLTSLYAYIYNCEQIGHNLGLHHGDLFHSLKIADPVAESVDDLDILDIQDCIPGIAKTFHVVSETLIMLLHDGLQGLSCRWMLVRVLKVLNEHST